MQQNNMANSDSNKAENDSASVLTGLVTTPYRRLPDINGKNR